MHLLYTGKVIALKGQLGSSNRDWNLRNCEALPEDLNIQLSIRWRQVRWMDRNLQTEQSLTIFDCTAGHSVSSEVNKSYLASPNFTSMPQTTHN